MTDSQQETKPSPSRWLWIAIILAMIITFVVWLLDPLGKEGKTGMPLERERTFEVSKDVSTKGIPVNLPSEPGMKSGSPAAASSKPPR